MPDLITLDRALDNLNNLATTDDQNTTLAALITAVSCAIEKYCWQSFFDTSYDELYPGSLRSELILRHYPVLAVERVACMPVGVLRVSNNSPSNQRATVKVTSTGLELINVASGVATTNDIAFADQPTLSALAAAVIALGNGWSALVIDPNDGLRASADLRALQGAFGAMNVNADLKLHKIELSRFGVEARLGILTREHGMLWDGGMHFWRVIYSAGYENVPDDVQEACAEWVAQLFWQTQRDPGLASEKISGIEARVPLQTMPGSAKLLLAPYRNWRV